MIIFGTGHRPNKLGGYSAEAQGKVYDVAYRWLEAKRPRKVVAGMAQGWDMALAEAAVALGIGLIATIPFKGYDSMWPQHSRDHRDKIIRNATIVVVSDPGYAAWKLQRRNVWMVDHAEEGVALWDGSPGGTHNCVQYAFLRGKLITNLWSEFNAG